MSSLYEDPLSGRSARAHSPRGPFSSPEPLQEPARSGNSSGPPRRSWGSFARAPRRANALGQTSPPAAVPCEEAARVGGCLERPKG
eukprot:5160766-Alexandrium_andersonii.AAC.1